MEGNEPPGATGWPVVGETFAFVSGASDMSFVERRRKRYGDRFKSHVLGRSTIFYTSAADADDILAGSYSKHTSISSGYGNVGNFAALLPKGNALLDDGKRGAALASAMRSSLKDMVQMLAIVAWDKANLYLERMAKGEIEQLYEAAKEAAEEAQFQCFLNVERSSNEGQWVKEKEHDYFMGMQSFPVNLNIPGMPQSNFSKSKDARSQLLHYFEKRLAASQGNGNGSLSHLEKGMLACGLNAEDVASQMVLLMNTVVPKCMASLVCSAVVAIARGTDVPYVSRLRSKCRGSFSTFCVYVYVWHVGNALVT